jgi:hypothetical protein
LPIPKSPDKFTIENELESSMIDHVQNILFSVMNSLPSQLMVRVGGWVSEGEERSNKTTLTQGRSQKFAKVGAASEENL